MTKPGKVFYSLIVAAVIIMVNQGLSGFYQFQENPSSAAILVAQAYNENSNPGVWWTDA